MKSTVDSKGRITLPKQYRDKMNINCNDEISVNIDNDKLLITKDFDLQEINNCLDIVNNYIIKSNMNIECKSLCFDKLESIKSFINKKED